MLPGFSKNLLAAVKMIETMMGSSQSKIKVVEKDLWREYQTLESHLEQRTKKLDRLEAIVRNSIVTGQITPHSHSLTETQARLVRLEDAYRQLKVENHTLRAAAEARRAAYAAADHNGGLDSPGGGSPSPSVPTGPKAKASASKIPKSGSRSTLSRPVASSNSVTTPSRSTSQHYFSQHHSRQSLAAPGADEIGVARSRGASPVTPIRTSGGGGGDDDDTLTLPTPTQASHSHQERGRDRSRGRSTNTALRPLLHRARHNLLLYPTPSPTTTATPPPTPPLTPAVVVPVPVPVRAALWWTPSGCCG